MLKYKQLICLYYAYGFLHFVGQLRQPILPAAGPGAGHGRGSQACHSDFHTLQALLVLSLFIKRFIVRNDTTLQWLGPRYKDTQALHTHAPVLVFLNKA